ncbi:MAG: hypothetical protein EBR05_11170 [Marivivens sp.]|nr:hypothetical protein [Marivivens sp.]
MINQQIDPSMPSITSTFDVASDSPISAIMDIAKISDVNLYAFRRVADASNGWPQVEVSFYTNDDAIAFTEVYLGSEDLLEIQEYLGFDVITEA